MSKREIEMRRRPCPYCGAALRKRLRRSVQCDVDLVSRLDRRRHNLWTRLLAALGLMSLSLYYLHIATDPAKTPWKVLAGILVPVVTSLAVFAVFYFRRPGEERSVGLAVLRTLATFGTLVAVLGVCLFLICVFIICVV